MHYLSMLIVGVFCFFNLLIIICPKKKKVPRNGR
jgi:hypothetical protein